MARAMAPQLRTRFDAAVQQSQEARQRGDFEAARRLLERAHIIGQAWVVPHLESHWEMLKLGVIERSWRDVIGQLLRLALVMPGTWLGRLPLGNTGGTNVNMFEPMPLPDDLKELLGQAGDAA